MEKNTGGENAPVRERKAVKFELENTGEGGEFSGYAAVFGNEDDGGDIIEKGAFTKTLAEDFSRIKILVLHNNCWLPVGKPIELREDEKGLFIRGKISDTQQGRDVLTLMRDGVLTELSIGYDTIVADLDADGIRHLKEVKLWEVSVVTWAMNEQATIEEVKSVTASLRAEAKAGKLSRSKLESLKPFIAVVRELADILSPFLDPPSPQDTTEEPEAEPEDSEKNKTKQTKSAGIVFEIIPSKSRR